MSKCGSCNSTLYPKGVDKGATCGSCVVCCDDDECPALRHAASRSAKAASTPVCDKSRQDLIGAFTNALDDGWKCPHCTKTLTDHPRRTVPPQSDRAAASGAGASSTDATAAAEANRLTRAKDYGLQPREYDDHPTNFVGKKGIAKLLALLLAIKPDSVERTEMTRIARDAAVAAAAAKTASKGPAAAYADVAEASGTIPPELELDTKEPITTVVMNAGIGNLTSSSTRAGAAGLIATIQALLLADGQREARGEGPAIPIPASVVNPGADADAPAVSAVDALGTQLVKMLDEIGRVAFLRWLKDFAAKVKTRDLGYVIVDPRSGKRVLVDWVTFFARLLFTGHRQHLYHLPPDHAFDFEATLSGPHELPPLSDIVDSGSSVLLKAMPMWGLLTLVKASNPQGHPALGNTHTVWVKSWHHHFIQLRDKYVDTKDMKSAATEARAAVAAAAPAHGAAAGSGRGGSGGGGRGGAGAPSGTGSGGHGRGKRTADGAGLPTQQPTQPPAPPNPTRANPHNPVGGGAPTHPGGAPRYQRCHWNDKATGAQCTSTPPPHILAQTGGVKDPLCREHRAAFQRLDSSDKTAFATMLRSRYGIHLT